MTTLLVASTGGHLNELVALAPRIVPRDDDILWVTQNTLQSSSLLGDQRTLFVPDLGSRDLPGTAVMALRAWRILRKYRPERVLSTGSGIAVAFLPTARTLGIPCHYIESGTRVTGPSVTGRILRRIPGVHRYTQHAQWASPHWSYAGSILDGFQHVAMDTPPRVRRVVVTLGSWRQPFRRLIEQLIPLLPDGVEVQWQTGHTDVSGLVDRPTPWLSAADLRSAVRRADLVVTHAGMGAVLDALEAGRCPVVVPREREHGEQIDNHQVELAAELGRRGLAVVREPDALTTTALLEAASRRIIRTRNPRPFVLAEP
ncbi:glycosyltransferase [Blastococcus mobilis]|uniref:UDP-N-acetylglucosamine:LPS N-acetylglucosamine transferase n=1 Tax=Blastococcus mobilis TaxID=1938746 RepID=A0A238Z3K3_9ACTN|nr:glycosyltransferase [Blastococcus mobilis]SNR77568.1 UDP-N-acetylglucosamine:LPS N-acetylglucosamine transferase [Blastococcus mobilis]